MHFEVLLISNTIESYRYGLHSCSTAIVDQVSTQFLIHFISLLDIHQIQPRLQSNRPNGPNQGV